MSRRLDFPVGLRMAAACAMLLASTLTAHAASVRAVGTSDLAAKSQFIFQGRVTEKRVTAGSRPGSIVTRLRFTVLDVLKGARGQTSVELSFLGGTLNGRTLRVEGLRMPAVGEEGIFFVERLDGRLVQPFYGWDQGRFLVRTDAHGRRFVTTHDQRPVSRVDASGAQSVVARGHAAGIVTSADEREALSVAEFKSGIRAILRARP